MPFNNTTRVLEILNAAGATADQLHTNLVSILRECAGSTKAAIVSEPDLARIFSHSFKGLDRRRVVAWFETYSPVRVKFADNGKFEKIGWSKTHVAKAKEVGKPVFDADAAAADPWFEFEPAQTTKAKAVDLDKAITTFAKAVAKAAYGGDLRKTLDKAQDAIREDLMSKVLEYMGTETFLTWSIARDEAIEIEMRAKAQAMAERDAANAAQVAKISELRAQLKAA